MRKFKDTPFLMVIGKLALAALAVVLVFCFILIVMNGVDKEAKRLELTQDYNCKYYAESINETYGREVCPPTERG